MTTNQGLFRESIFQKSILNLFDDMTSSSSEDDDQDQIDN